MADGGRMAGPNYEKTRPFASRIMRKRTRSERWVGQYYGARRNVKSVVTIYCDRPGAGVSLHFCPTRRAHKQFSRRVLRSVMLS